MITNIYSIILVPSGSTFYDAEIHWQLIVNGDRRETKVISVRPVGCRILEDLLDLLNKRLEVGYISTEERQMLERVENDIEIEFNRQEASLIAIEMAKLAEAQKLPA
ncbi:MAG: hypothetical protein AAFX93_19820 [Verrucomicrobiota bacterium]